MELTAFTLIVLVEVFALSFLAIVVMAFYIRKLKSLLAAAQQKAPPPQPKKQQALTDAKLSHSAADADALAAPEHASIASKHSGLDLQSNSAQVQTYTSYIDEQITNLRDYHGKLKGGQEIALDIDPSAPLERRVAAMRHAVLIAEREATLTDEVNWLALEARYKALFSYYEDYPSPQAQARIKDLSDSLGQSHKQLAALEKYKKLYFDLEANWHACKNQADAYYKQIQGQVELVEGESTGALVALVDNYHHSYSAVTQLFDEQEPLPETLKVANKELIELRKMTAQQHQLIDDLKQKMKSANDDNIKVELIRELESQLVRHERFLAESESCIKLMEDELAVTYKELQSLKAKLKVLPDLKAQIKDLNEDAGVSDVMLNRLKEDVKKLKLELAQAVANKPKADPKSLLGQVQESGVPSEIHQVNDFENDLENDFDQLKIKHEQLEKQYADLEERYLDLKLES